MAVKFLNLDGIKVLIAKLVPNTRKVNGKALSSDITLSASDVSAYSKTEIDTKLAGVSGLPAYTADDEGKFLRIVDGTPKWVAIPNAEEASF